MIAIVNVDENWGIGRDGDQPFYIPGDLKFFKEKTEGKTVIMGRATFDALPPNARPLPKRENVVLTRQSDLKIEGVTICNSFDDLKAYASNDAFVIGGADVYKNLLPYCTKAYVTKTFADGVCDRWFENLDEMPNWKLIEKSEMYEYDSIKFQFCTYVNERAVEFNGD